MPKEKKRTQKKAPDAPKRGKSPYIYFSMEKREQVKRELGPGAPVTEIMRRIADMWRPLTDDQKAPWAALSAQDKARYEQEMANYDGPLRVPNKRAKKDPDAPKRAMPAFLFYSQENRPKIKAQDVNLKNTEISRLLGQQWKVMDDSSKAYYHKLEQQDRARYKIEMENYNAMQVEQKHYAQMKRHMSGRIPQEAPPQQMHMAPPLAHYQTNHHPHVSDHYLYHNNFNPSMAAAQMMDPSRVDIPSTAAPVQLTQLQHSGDQFREQTPAQSSSNLHQHALLQHQAYYNLNGQIHQ